MRHALVVAALTVAACGDVPTYQDAAPPPVDPCTQPTVSVDDFFACLSQAVCDIYDDCLGSDSAHIDCRELGLTFFGSLPPASMKVLIREGTADGRLQWDPAGAAACLASLQNNGCRLFKANADPFDTCEPIIGNINNGQPCQHDVECATPGAECESATGGTDRCVGYTCRAPVAAGQLCPTGTFCRPEDHCVRRTSGGDVCATGEAGQVCDSNDDCDLGLFCNGGNGSGSAAGICTASKNAGATCLADEECAGELVCVGNLNGATGTCRDVRAAGATCDPGLYAACFGEQYCDSPPNAQGTCRGQPLLGQTCANLNGTPTFCGVFMVCDTTDNLCRVPGGLGDTCTTSSSSTVDGCTIGLWCDRDLTMAATGTCVAPRANGQQCRTDNTSLTSGSSRMCLSGWCTNNVCTDFPTCTF